MAEPIDLAKLFKIPVPTQMGFDDPIIVIEDQQDLRLIIVHHLQKMNFSTVKHVANGYEALELLNDHKGSATFICDLDMPVMGGLDLLGELRERTDVERGPFLLTMDHVSKEKAMLAVENGVDDILAKPFTYADIIPKLRNAHKVFHNPKNPEKVYEMAKRGLRNNDLASAETIYKALADAAPKAARPWVGLARIALARKDLPAAHTLLNAAEQRNANYVHTYSMRGDMYVTEQKWDDAYKAFKKAIDLSPLNPMRYRAAAELLFKVNRFQEAVLLLEEAIKHSLEFKELYHFLSQAQFALKDYAKAARYIRSALSTDPDNVVFLNQLGISLKESQQYDEATKVYNQIIKLEPDNKAALYNKAILLNTKGDTAEAIKLLERVVRKYPEFNQAVQKLTEFRKQKSPGAA